VSSINRVLRNLTTETHRAGGGGHHIFTSSHVYNKFGGLFGGSQPWTHRAGHPWYAAGPGCSAGGGGSAGMFHGTDMATKLAGGDVAFHHVNRAHQMTSLVAGPLQYGAVDRKCESFWNRLWNQLPDLFRQPSQSCLDSSLISSQPISAIISTLIIHHFFIPGSKPIFSTNPAHLNFSPLLIGSPS